MSDKLNSINSYFHFPMLELIVNNIKEGVVVTDTGGTIVWVNPAFTTITGYSAEEAIRQNPRILKSDYHDHSFYKKPLGLNFDGWFLGTGNLEQAQVRGSLPGIAFHI